MGFQPGTKTGLRLDLLFLRKIEFSEHGIRQRKVTHHIYFDLIKVAIVAIRGRQKLTPDHSPEFDDARWYRS